MRRLVPSLLLLSACASWAAEVEIQALDREGKPLLDAVLVLESAMPGPRPVPPAELVINQEGMKFVPALAVAHLGSKVSFSNLDRWEHHVRGGLVGPGGVYVDPAKGYSFRLPARVAGKAPSTAAQAFTQTGPQMLGCHLHGSMRGFLYITDSPWAAVTNAEGRVKFSGVPAGAARLRVWHADELAESPLQALQVVEGMATQRLPTQITPRKPKRAAPEELKLPGY